MSTRCIEFIYSSLLSLVGIFLRLHNICSQHTQFSWEFHMMFGFMYIYLHTSLYMYIYYCTPINLYMYVNVICVYLCLIAVVTCSLPTDFPSHLHSVEDHCAAGSAIDYSTTCSFACDTGYNLFGSTSLSCTESGAISTDLPNCTSMFDWFCYVKMCMYLYSYFVFATRRSDLYIKDWNIWINNQTSI